LTAAVASSNVARDSGVEEAMTSKLRLKVPMLVVSAAWAGSPVAHAASIEVDKYPTKPIRLIAPFVPGGGTDITARAIAAKLTERWGQ
jgi:tripartite-type tricarboxylate transporter receptor subunit TctC